MPTDRFYLGPYDEYAINVLITEFGFKSIGSYHNHQLLSLVRAFPEGREHVEVYDHGIYYHIDHADPRQHPIKHLICDVTKIRCKEIVPDDEANDRACELQAVMYNPPYVW